MYVIVIEILIQPQLTFCVLSGVKGRAADAPCHGKVGNHVLSFADSEGAVDGEIVVGGKVWLVVRRITTFHGEVQKGLMLTIAHIVCICDVSVTD